MIQQPFALDQFFEEMLGDMGGGIAQSKSREGWFGKKADEASLFAAEQVEAAKKKMEGAEGWFGKNPWMKTVIPLLANAIVPGSGLIVGGLMSGADAAKRQSQYKNRLEDIEKMSEKASSKYAGTFLEDYVTNALSGIKTSTKEGLKGLKTTDLISGLIETGLSILPGVVKAGGNATGEVVGEVTEEAAKKASEEAAKKTAEEVAKEKALEASAKKVFPKAIDFSGRLPSKGTNVYQNLPDDAGFLNKLFGKIENEGLTKGLGLDKLFASDTNASNVIEETVASQPRGPLTAQTSKLPQKLLSLIPGVDEKMLKTVSTPMFGLDYTKEVGEEGTKFAETLLPNLLASIATPTYYAGPARDALMDELLKGQGEASVARAQNPYRRYSV